MKNIVLTGFMGTGKTAVGSILAQRLGHVLIDVDSEIEKEQNMKISDIFREHGQPEFRNIESEMIKRLSELNRAVISTGGGAVLRQQNIDNLKRKGIIVCLTASPETIYNRTKCSNDRPLLNVEDPLDEIRKLLDYRKPYYENADIVIDTEGKSPVEVAEEIIEIIRSGM